MVPVGGAIVSSSSKENIKRFSENYPGTGQSQSHGLCASPLCPLFLNSTGRASASPIVDLLITLLGMGRVGFKQLLQRRKELMASLQEQLTAVADSCGSLFVFIASPDCLV